jgi:hypothetical protein
MLQFAQVLEKIRSDRVDLISVEKNHNQFRVISEDLVWEGAKLISTQIYPLQIWKMLEGVGLDRCNFIAVKIQVLNGTKIFREKIISKVVFTLL